MFPISDLLSEQEKNTTLNEKHLGSTLDDFLKEDNLSIDSPPETNVDAPSEIEIDEPSNIATKKHIRNRYRNKDRI